MARPIITVTVDTGGIDAQAAKVLEQRARALGAQDHILVAAKQAYFDQVIKYLIMGNVKRGQMYPLCVGAERVMQAQTIAEYARKLGTKVVAHGCTAAGNDQVRFEVALRTLAPELTILAPVRDQRVQASRAAEVSRRAQAADPAVRRRVLGESRPVGRDDRRQGNADVRRQHSGSRLGAVEERVQRAAGADDAHDRLRARRAREPRRRAARSGAR